MGFGGKAQPPMVPLDANPGFNQALPPVPSFPNNQFGPPPNNNGGLPNPYAMNNNGFGNSGFGGPPPPGPPGPPGPPPPSNGFGNNNGFGGPPPSNQFQNNFAMPQF